MKKDDIENFKNFIKLFEEVFHNDWKYTKEMLHYIYETKEQKQNTEEMGIETITIISEQGTFIKPKVEDEFEDWGYRGKLLEQYRKVKSFSENW